MTTGRTRHRIAFLVLIASAPALAAGPESEPGTEAAPSRVEAEAPAAEPAKPIPVAEVAVRAERVAIWLRGLAPEIEDRAKLDGKEQELEATAARVWDGLTDTRLLLGEGPRPSVVDGAELAWLEGRQQVSDQSDALTASAQETEDALEKVRVSQERWKLTGDAAREADAPATVIARIENTQREIDLAREQLLALRERILSLQDKSARLVAVADEVLATLAAHRRDSVERIGAPSSRPLWHESVTHADPATAMRRIAVSFEREVSAARRFVERRADVLRFQAVLLFVLVLLFRTARSRTARRVQDDPSLRESVAILDAPNSAAILLTLLSSLWLHPRLPDLLANAVALASLLPLARLLRQVIPGAFFWLAYTLAGFFVFDRLGDILAPAPLVEQLALVLEMAAGLGLVVRLLRSGRLRPGAETGEWARALRVVGVAAHVLGVVFAVALGAAVFGYMQIARYLASTSLGAVYIGMALYAAARAARGLAGFLLCVRPLASLRSVQRHRDLVERRVASGIGWVAIGTWVFALLRTLGQAGASADLLQGLLAADLAVGPITLTVGDVLGVVATVWASFLISRFVRFALGEEIYPRLSLPHGAPYAISSLVHYAILLGGFFLALSAMGLDLNKFTVLGGALGVGIGFGLQTIVNNFVSGLILLFERPVQIGDTVQVADVAGEVRRIGIRSSTIRTSSGAEVIVPNSDLISQRVTNWTLSDRSRRFEIPVGVAYGTRPEKVLALLAEVAAKHPEVLSHPAPTALFVGFGQSSLDFELRAWVVDGDRLNLVKTEVAVALSQALEAAGIEIPFPQQEITVRRKEKEERPHLR